MSAAKKGKAAHSPTGQMLVEAAPTAELAKAGREQLRELEALAAGKPPGTPVAVDLETWVQLIRFLVTAVDRCATVEGFQTRDAHRLSTLVDDVVKDRKHTVATWEALAERVSKLEGAARDLRDWIEKGQRFIEDWRKDGDAHARAVNRRLDALETRVSELDTRTSPGSVRS